MRTRACSSILVYLALVAAANDAKPSVQRPRIEDMELEICGNAVFDAIEDKRLVPEGFLSFEQRNGLVGRQRDNGTTDLGSLQKQELVVIRLHVVYDQSILDKLGDLEKLKRYLRNLVYSAQLYFERSELWNEVRITLRVVSLASSTTIYGDDLTSTYMLYKFGRSKDIVTPDKADLNLLVLYRTMWSYPHPTVQAKTLGIANLGTFCSAKAELERRVILLSADSLGSAKPFAHELTHQLNVLHDDDQSGQFEKHCERNSFIMSPSSGLDKIGWSSCTIDRIKDFFGKEEILRCIRDETRRSTRALEPRFDFWPIEADMNPARSPLPGEDMQVDEQCTFMLGPKFTSVNRSFKEEYQQMKLQICREHNCILNQTYGDYLVNVGPAPSGSECLRSDTFETALCFQSSCCDEKTCSDFN